MAKAKNKRNSGLADKVHGKRKGDIQKKKLNPFEIHINREKMKVLGKKSKNEWGMPGVSRTKSTQKRKAIIYKELSGENTANAFIDRRIGEKDNRLTSEERMTARFTAERSKQHSKTSIFNLADDEILTHRGQTLEQIEKFDDPGSTDEEDGAGEFGGLDDDFVSEGHFGGGVLSKTEKDGAKSHKDLIEQLIAESKKRKAEKQKEKEQTLDLTEKLDSEWKDLQPVVFKRARLEKESESLIDKVLSQAEKKSADYDKMMRELKFEKRGTPSDGIKTDEKQAKEEMKKLEQLEKERQKRMYDDEEIEKNTNTEAKKYKSADSLECNYQLDDEPQYMLAYNKNALPLIPAQHNGDPVPKTGTVPDKLNEDISDTSSVDEENSAEENEDEGSADESENAEETDQNVKSVKKQVKNSEGQEKSESSDNDDDDDDDEESVVEKKTKEQKLKDKNKTQKSIEDLDDTILFKNVKDSESSNEENSSEESGNEESEEEEAPEEKTEQQKPKKDDYADLKESDKEENSDDESVGEDDMEKIGSFFDIEDGEGENLKVLLTDKTPSQQAAAIQKLIKSYNPSLGESNKEKLSRLYAHMLQYINDTFTNITNEGDLIKAFLIFDKLAPYFYDLAHTNKVSAMKYLVALIKEKRVKFLRNGKHVPDFDTLVLFKLVSLIYPTSDFKHPVTTPSLIFMSEILSYSKYRTRYAISRGLFVTALVLEYTALSKRLVPSAVNFIRGILYSCAKTSILNPIQVVPPFRLHRDAKILNLEDDCSKMAVENKMAAKDLVLKDIDNYFKIRTLLTITAMFREFFENFNDLEAQKCLFEPHLQLYGLIDLELYPVTVASTINSTLKYVKEHLDAKKFTPIMKERQRPKLLRLYTPDVQEVFTGNKYKNLPRQMLEDRKIQNRVKSESKGAIREIRRDREFFANMRIRQKIQSDNIRKEKVKQIYKDASIQQGELNKLKRMK